MASPVIDDISPKKFYPAMCILGIIILIGSFGNAIVLWVYWRKNDKLTATLFIQSLAIVDFVTCTIIIPMSIVMEVIQFHTSSSFFCKFYYILNTSVVPYSSLLMTAIAVDRYLCICHPFLRVMNLKRAKVIIALLAIISLFMGVLVAFLCTRNASINKFKYLVNESDLSYDNNTYSYVCLETSTFSRSGGVAPLWEIVLNNVIQKVHTACFIICICVVIVLYILIYLTVLAMRNRKCQIKGGKGMVLKNNVKHCSGKQAKHEQQASSTKSMLVLLSLNKHGMKEKNGLLTASTETTRALVEQFAPGGSDNASERSDTMELHDITKCNSRTIESSNEHEVKLMSTNLDRNVVDCKEPFFLLEETKIFTKSDNFSMNLVEEHDKGVHKLCGEIENSHTRCIQAEHSLTIVEVDSTERKIHDVEMSVGFVDQYDDIGLAAQTEMCDTTNFIEATLELPADPNDDCKDKSKQDKVVNSITVNHEVTSDIVEEYDDKMEKLQQDEVVNSITFEKDFVEEYDDKEKPSPQDEVFNSKLTNKSKLQNVFKNDSFNEIEILESTKNQVSLILSEKCGFNQANCTNKCSDIQIYLMDDCCVGNCSINCKPNCNGVDNETRLNLTDEYSTPLIHEESKKCFGSIVKSLKLEKESLHNLKTAAMLFVVALVFIITFLPAGLMANGIVNFDIVFFYIYYANNAANPIIYCFMNKYFRDDLRKLFSHNLSPSKQ